MEKKYFAVRGEPRLGYDELSKKNFQMQVGSMIPRVFWKDQKNRAGTT